MWHTKHFNSFWQYIVSAWLLCGILGTIVGFAGLFYRPVSIVLLIPIIVILIVLAKSSQLIFRLANIGKAVMILICIWWLLHSMQVFVPETSFDAVWYHLPLAQQTVEMHRFVGDTNFYQSFNPQFSDSIFYLGYAVGGELGTKVVAYFLGLTLVFLTYVTSRKILSSSLSLVVVLLVSSFQVISWQSSSFYVDIAKAIWELSALVLIIEKKSEIKSGIAFGASLATKLFSLLVLPVLILLVIINQGKSKLWLFTFSSLLIALPFYVFAYSVSGDPFYSLSHHLSILSSIATANNVPQYLLSRTILLPQALLQLVYTREYTTPFMVLLIPLAIMYRKSIFNSKIQLSLLLFSIYQLAVWWLVPPTSVRYALSGFITATILTVFLINTYAKEKKLEKQIIYVLILLGIAAIPIRVLVAIRSWQYLSGSQTKTQYLQQFYDGNVDQKLKKWHQID